MILNRNAVPQLKHEQSINTMSPILSSALALFDKVMHSFRKGYYILIQCLKKVTIKHIISIITYDIYPTLSAQMS